jgi:uncharacterized membrane protein
VQADERPRPYIRRRPDVLRAAIRRPLDPLTLAIAAALVVAVVLRFWPRSSLWLDEAQSVAFARLPLAHIPHALRTDGAPPLYYLILHVWMRLFGSGNLTVRALSALISLATLPVVGVVARRLGGARAVWPAVLLAALNPFAIRYASETRMYALVVLEVTLGLLLLLRAQEQPTRWNLASVSLVTAALLYTHYWSLYLLAASGVILVALAWRHRSTPQGQVDLRVVGTLVVGGVLWLPWLPSFRFQNAHTATPWTRPPSLGRALDVLPIQSGGHEPLAVFLSCILGVLVALALFAQPREPWRTEIRVPSYPPARALLALFGLASLFATLGGRFSGSAFVGRYTSVVFPVLVMLVAIGASHIGRRDARIVVVALACVVGTALAIEEAHTPRTPAASFARYLDAEARPGDIVVFCPDQLGPAVSRLLADSPVSSLQQGTFPRWAPPTRVNWVDYGTRYKVASASEFAADAVHRAGHGAIWLVWSSYYPPTEPSCLTLRAALSFLRPTEEQLVKDRPDDYLDHGALLRYPASKADAIVPE